MKERKTITLPQKKAFTIAEVLPLNPDTSKVTIQSRLKEMVNTGKLEASNELLTNRTKGRPHKVYTVVANA